MASNAQASSAADAHAAVFVPSVEVPPEAIRIQGPDFNLPIELDALLQSYEKIGFQANGLKRACDIINRMVSLSLDIYSLCFARD
jgi:deoxyhypusine synthase